MSPPAPSGRLALAALLAACLLVYGLTTYGGVRSPDGEVVFRTCDALATRGTFAVEEGLDWAGFGLAPGRDGRLFSVFGPLQALACVPLLALGDGWLGGDEARAALLPAGTSFHVERGLLRALAGAPPERALPHARRFFAGWLNVAVTAAAAGAFLGLAARVGGGSAAGLAVALLFAFGSLAWPYAGTFFSEPLATALAVGSLALLTAGDRGLGADGRRREGWAGLLLGLSVTAHLTSVLFVPFFGAYAVAVAPGVRRARAGAALRFALGLAGPLAALGLHDLLRFGSPFETGRGVDAARAAALGYGVFVPPGEGLYGLLVSSGKGLLLYCPAVVVGLVAWPALARRSRPLARALAAAALLRLLFVAARSDWHGGFSPGPRLLVPLVPFLLLPVAAWLAERPERFRIFVPGALACVAQQLQLALAEVFGFLHLTNRPDADFAWEVSPLLHLWQARLAPFWLARTGLGVAEAWLAGAALLLPLLWLALRRLAPARTE